MGTTIKGPYCTLVFHYHQEMAPICTRRTRLEKLGTVKNPTKKLQSIPNSFKVNVLSDHNFQSAPLNLHQLLLTNEQQGIYEKEVQNKNTKLDKSS